MNDSKIIILTDVFLPYKGGGQIYVWEVAQRLVNSFGLNVEIVTRKLKVDGKCFGDNKNLLKGKLKITRLGWCAKWNNVVSRLYYCFAAVFYLLKKDFDLIDAQAFVGAVPGKIIAWLKKKPLVFTVHGTNLETGKAGFLEKMILTRFHYDQEITVSSNFIKYVNVNKNIEVVHPGVDLNEFCPRRELVIRGRVLYVGRLTAEKGIDNLLEIFRFFKNKPVSFIIVGEGEAKKKIRNFLKNEKIKNVSLRGSLDHAVILNEYQKADIFILPSHFEGLPISVLEAMACGVPIVVSNLGDLPKFVKNKINGFIVRHNDPRGFINKIQMLIENENLKKAMSNNNQQLSKNYSWGKTAADIYKIYQNL